MNEPTLHCSTMFDMIERYFQSGMTKKDYCQKESIPEWKFYYWQRRYREQNQEVGFAALKIARTKRDVLSAPVKIYYPNGVFIQLPCSTEISTIRSLIGLL